MSNLFDSNNYPVTEPDLLFIGDYWTWKRTDLSDDYDPDDYALKYTFQLAGDGTTEFDITASESTGEYVVEVAAATTAGYTAGTYHWQAYITRASDSERITVDRGVVVVKDNLDASSADPRTHAEICLDAIETEIQNLNFAISTYSISNRSMAYRTLEELEKMRDKYRAEVAQEKRAKNGSGGSKLVYRL